MCLGVPGRVMKWVDRTEPFSRAIVDFDGVRREVAMGCVPDSLEGEYVIVHAGVAIGRLSESEAEALLTELSLMLSSNEEEGTDQ